MSAGLWAFSDESERGNRMLFSVVFVPVRAVAGARADLRKLLLPGQRRIHTAKESARRRKELLKSISRIDGLNAVVLAHRRCNGVDRCRGRELLVRAATHLVIERGTTAWTLDDQDHAQRNRDRDTIGHMTKQIAAGREPVYDHHRNHSEPLLWAADAVCRAEGAGHDWRRRIASVLSVENVVS